MVDCGGLENHWPRKGSVGSNPTPSSTGKHAANLIRIINEVLYFVLKGSNPLRLKDVKRFPFIIMKLKWVTDKIVEKYGFQPKVRT